jgi:hypothetical protein
MSLQTHTTQKLCMNDCNKIKCKKKRCNKLTTRRKKRNSYLNVMSNDKRLWPYKMKSYKHKQWKKCKQRTTQKLCKSKCNKNKVQKIKRSNILTSKIEEREKWHLPNTNLDMLQIPKTKIMVIVTKSLVCTAHKLYLLILMAKVRIFAT